MKPYYRILRTGHSRVAPFKTESLKEVEAEAIRLAAIEPGETFEILQCLGIARTSEPSVFWNDGIEPPATSLPGQPEVEVDPGEGYRLIEIGERVEVGDEWFANGCWLETHRAATEVPRVLGQLPLRRKIAETRYPTTPLPEGFGRWVCRGLGWFASGVVFTTGYAGEDPNWDARATLGYTGAWPRLEYWEAVKDESGYRMLEAGERMLEGDEFLVAGSNNQWLKRQLNLGQPWSPELYAATRRPTTNTLKP